MPRIGVMGILLGGILRLLAAIFHWPLLLVLGSDIVLFISVVYILMYDFFPIFLEPFFYIRHKFQRRPAFFIALLLLFFLCQLISFLLSSGPVKDMMTNLAFLSFMSSIVWFIGTYIVANFTPYVRYLKRKPREVEKIYLSDIVTSLAIIITPTVILSFFFSPPGLSQTTVTPYTVFLTSLLTNILMLLYLYLLIVRPKVFTWKQLGLRKVAHDDLKRALVLFLFVGSLIAILQALLLRLGLPLNQYSFTSKDGAYLAYAVVVLITPIAEELYFRGFLFKGLLIHQKPWLAYVISAGLFALLHPPLLVMVEVFCIGLLLAYTLRETKSVWPGVLIHAVNNAVVFGYLLYR